jgi:hypothetical protein
MDALLSAGADAPPEFKSATSDLLDEALSEPRTHRTRVERWVDEPGSFDGGRWEWVEDV